MRIMIPILCFCFCLSAFASKHKLALITSDIDNILCDFYVITNAQNDLESISYVNYLSDGKILEDVVFPGEKILQDGVVLESRNGYDVVRLEVDPTFKINIGGMIELKYLFNGITGTWRSQELLLIKEGNDFVLKNTQNQVVNHIHFLSNWKKFVGAIGVREVQTSYIP